MVKSNIVLISPPPEYTSGKGASLGGPEHLGLGYLASALKNYGYDVYIKNYEEMPINEETACEEVLALNPILIGISPTSYSINWSINFGKNIKKKSKVYICLGGHLATHLGNTILDKNPCFDIVSVGDGEKAICELVNHITQGENKFNDIENLIFRDDSNNIIHSSSSKELYSLDDLEWPMRPDGNRRSARIVMSRGCLYNCDFCTTPSFYNNKIRYRSLEDVVSEMVSLYQEKGTKQFFFTDDSFLINRQDSIERAYKFIDLIKRELPDIEFRCEIRADVISKNMDLIKQLYRSGMKYLFVGYESCLDNDLKIYNKHCDSSIIMEIPKLLRDIGISVIPGFIMYNQETTFDDLKRKIDFLLQNNYLYRTTFFSRTCMGYPGSQMFREMMDTFNYDKERSNDYLLYPSFSNDGIRTMSKAFQEIEMLYLDIDLKLLHTNIYIFEEQRLRNKDANDNMKGKIAKAYSALNQIQQKYYSMYISCLEIAEKESNNNAMDKIKTVFIAAKKDISQLSKQFETMCNELSEI